MIRFPPQTSFFPPAADALRIVANGENCLRSLKFLAFGDLAVQFCAVVFAVIDFFPSALFCADATVFSNFPT
jgi:hypothetical protein